MGNKKFDKKFADRVFGVSWQDAKSGLVSMPDKSLDHVITDPPYSEYVHTKNWGGGNSAKGPKVKKIAFASLSASELKEVATQIVRVTRGWALVFCADDDIRAWRDAFDKAGARRSVTCIWTKPNGTPQFRGESPAQPCEYIVTAWCGPPEVRPSWNGGGKLGHYVCSIEAPGVRRHETQKPVRLISNLVLDFTLPGDLIGDPYGGAGTLAVAARRAGRKFVLWERNEEHATAARAWVAGEREQLRVEALLHRARPAAFDKKSKAVNAEQLSILDEPT